MGVDLDAASVMPIDPELEMEYFSEIVEKFFKLVDH
jgi:hypothetical protein